MIYDNKTPAMRLVKLKELNTPNTHMVKDVLTDYHKIGFCVLLHHLPVVELDMAIDILSPLVALKLIKKEIKGNSLVLPKDVKNSMYSKVLYNLTHTQCVKHRELIMFTLNRFYTRVDKVNNKITLDSMLTHGLSVSRLKLVV